MPPIISKKAQYIVAKVLHWIVALIVLQLLLSGWRIGDYPLDEKESMIMIHSGLGATVFLLMLYRWWWRKSNKLYLPPGWQKKKSMLLQWFFYPLLVLQPVLGLTQAIFIDYKVLAFGFINCSELAVDNEGLFSIFHLLHAVTAALLMLFILFHAIERSKKFFKNDISSMKE